MFSGSFKSKLQDITVLESQHATFTCELSDERIEGQRSWWYKGKKVEASTDKYEKYTLLK